MNQRRNDGRETWHRLLAWDKGQTPSERLALTLMSTEDYRRVDPSHPLGGKDGGKDAILEKDDLKLILAVYFPRGQQDFATIKAKFIKDLSGVVKNAAEGFVFFTNQELRIGERKELHIAAKDIPIEIYHLELITTLLNKPVNYGTRLEFLDIAMTTEELLALYAQRDKEYLEQLTRVTATLEIAIERILNETSKLKPKYTDNTSTRFFHYIGGINWRADWQINRVKIDSENGILEKNYANRFNNPSMVDLDSAWANRISLKYDWQPSSPTD